MRFPKSTEKSMGLGARAAAAQSRGGRGLWGGKGVEASVPGLLGPHLDGRYALQFRRWGARDDGFADLR